MTPLGYILAAAALLLVRALAVAVQAALDASSTGGLKKASASAEALAAFAHLRAHPENTFVALRAVRLGAAALGAGFATVGGVWLVEPLLAELRPGPWAALASTVLSAGVAGLVIFVLDLVFRAFAAARPEGWTRRTVRAVVAIGALAGPPNRLLARLLGTLLAPLGARIQLVPTKPPLEEIERLLLEEAKQQRLDPQGPRLIRNIFEMSEKTARDVMVPRAHVVAVDIATPAAKVLEMLAEHLHSRMPVFRGEIDRIVGILHARDLVPMLQHPELIVVEDVVRPAHFIPWSKPVGEVLRELQKKKIHMALVVDEYGGFLGVVTLEDVLEVIVGEIRDEYDEEDQREIDGLSDGGFLVRASVPLEKFARHFGIEIPEGSYETLGGFLNALAGCIPEVGDSFFFAGLQFTVQDRGAKKVRRVRVHRARKDGARPAEASPRPLGTAKDG